MDLKALWLAAEPVFLEMIGPIAAELFARELEPGGQAYEQVMQGAIAGAKMWYGMYRPVKYQRGYTLSDRGNIAITHSDVTVAGTSLSATMDVENNSPHIGYTAGFEMRNGKFRPGGDVLSMVPSSVKVKIDVPAGVVTQCAIQAMQAVSG